MIGTLYEVVIDTPDVKGLSSFYGELTGLKVTHAGDDWVTLESPEGWKIAFQLAPDHVAPRWPDPAYPQQMHLDLVTDDVPAAVAQAEQLGATRLPGGGETFTVLADPAGHPFCICHRDGVAGVQVADVTIDCTDGAALAAFYAPLLGLEITYAGTEGAMISADGKLPVMFQNVQTYNPPRWPDPAHPQQIHLDVEITDAEEADQQVVARGATFVSATGETCRVYTDPVGHPFCLVW